MRSIHITLCLIFALSIIGCNEQKGSSSGPTPIPTPEETTGCQRSEGRSRIYSKLSSKYKKLELESCDRTERIALGSALLSETIYELFPNQFIMPSRDKEIIEFLKLYHNYFDSNGKLKDLPQKSKNPLCQE